MVCLMGNTMLANSLQIIIGWLISCCNTYYYMSFTHIWKACNRLKRFGGSNPPLSAPVV